MFNSNPDFFKYSITKVFFFNKYIISSAATPTISASASATSYEIAGTSVTLTCTSTSDSAGSGTYEWKLDSGAAMYV